MRAGMIKSALMGTFVVAAIGAVAVQTADAQGRGHGNGVGKAGGAFASTRFSSNPPGFSHGRKVGWVNGNPPGWSHGRKTGWHNGIVPPGLR